MVTTEQILIVPNNSFGEKTKLEFAIMEKRKQTRFFN